jgi:hypothetical protein
MSFLHATILLKLGEYEVPNIMARAMRNMIRK